MKLRARLVRLLETVEIVGLKALRAPHVKYIDGKLWELRVRAEEGIARLRAPHADFVPMAVVPTSVSSPWG